MNTLKLLLASLPPPGIAGSFADYHETLVVGGNHSMVRAGHDLCRPAGDEQHRNAKTRTGFSE